MFVLFLVSLHVRSPLFPTGIFHLVVITVLDNVLEELAALRPTDVKMSAESLCYISSDIRDHSDVTNGQIPFTEGKVIIPTPHLLPQKRTVENRRAKKRA